MELDDILLEERTSAITFYADSSVMLTKLRLHRGNVSDKALMPICETIKISVNGKKVNMTTSNLKQVIETSFEIETRCQPFEMCIPYKDLLKLLEALSEQGLKLTYNPSVYALTIKAGKGTYKLAGDDPTAFPIQFPTKAKTAWLKVSAAKLAGAFNKVLYAAAKEDLRPAQVGVFLEAEDDKLKLTALDGNILHQAVIDDYESLSPSTVLTTELIHHQSVSMLLSILPKYGEVTLHRDGRFVWVESDNFTFSSVNIDEKYPEYRNAIPASEGRIEVNVPEWLAALNRLSIFTLSSGVISVEVENNVVYFHAENTDFAKEAKEAIELEEPADELRIGLSSVQIKNALKHFTDEGPVTMEYLSSLRPVTFRQGEDFALLFHFYLRPKETDKN